MTPMFWNSLSALYETFAMGPLVALVIVLAVWKARTIKQYGVCAGVITVLLLPLLQREVGAIYFDHLCKTEAGEFIYKTVDNVEGVFQMRPRDGSKDYFDRMREGDIPEDPYGHTNMEARYPAGLFVNPPFARYQYLESIIPSGATAKIPNAKYRIYFGRDIAKKKQMIEEDVAAINSRYGYTWHGIGRLDYWSFNIYGGEIVVKDLRTEEVLAVKRGFLKVRPWAKCPMGDKETLVYDFVSKVLKPISSNAIRGER